MHEATRYVPGDRPGGRRRDLDRQVARVTTWAASQGLPVGKVVTEVGSALSGERRKFLALLRDETVTVIVAEHRGWFARFGAEYVEAALAAQGRRLLVADPSEVDGDLERHARPGSAVGIDLGVKTLLMRATLRKLRRASRAHSRKQPGSANRRRSAAKLARAVIDQRFGQARRILDYKTAWNGGTLVTADCFYPSSKTCSSCGWRKPSLTLKERVFACEHCGHAEDRDVNAARNLLKLAASGAESRNACGGTVRPGLAGQVSVKQEPGIPNGSKTGTAAPQGTAAA